MLRHRGRRYQYIESEFCITSSRHVAMKTFTVPFKLCTIKTTPKLLHDRVVYDMIFKRYNDILFSK